MTTVIDRIIQDHQHLSRLLDCLDYEVSGYREGSDHAPDLPIILEALDYLNNYPNTFHHPLETRLMARLRPRLIEKSARIQFDLIEQQHKQIEALTQKLMADFTIVAADQVVPVNLLLAECRLYSEFQRDHMKLENEIMIPAMKKLLTEEDFALVEDDLRHNPDPLFGAHLWENYESLYEYVVTQSSEQPETA